LDAIRAVAAAIGVPRGGFGPATGSSEGKPTGTPAESEEWRVFGDSARSAQAAARATQ